MEKYGFVYIWYDKWRQMYYIGSHWGNENDGYICSSNRMRDAYRRRPNDFKRRIISKIYHDSPGKTFLEESVWLKNIKQEELGKKYYNLTTNVRCLGHSGRISDETKLKMSLSTKGKVVSIETRQKLSKYFKGRPVGPFSEEHKKKIGLGNKGVTRKRSLEGNAKSAISNTGKKRTKEFCLNQSLAKLGDKNPMKNPEISKKVADKNRGRIPWNKGKTMTIEQKLKISNTLKGISN